jgi:hypothetical protein
VLCCTHCMCCIVKHCMVGHDSLQWHTYFAYHATVTELLYHISLLQLLTYTQNRGGIIALNYIARAGKQCPLSSCITIAGSFDTRTNMSFWHSRLVWQPLLGLCLKENFVVPHVHKLAARGMDAAALAGLRDVIHFDTHMVAKYHR